MIIIGISAFYHDAAACIIRDGNIVAAAQEERFSRKKHDPSFPIESINFCMRQAGISANEIDFFVFYEKPILKFKRLLSTYIATMPYGFRNFYASLPEWIWRKIYQKSSILKRLKCEISSEVDWSNRLLFSGHHLSHAASAFFPSPYHEAAILVADGVGEYATTSVSIGVNNNIKRVKEIHFPHSLGLLYTAFTTYLGFKADSGEYKVMGLAPYGQPKYVDLIKDNLIDLKEDGSFRLNMKYFNYCIGTSMTNDFFHSLFQGGPRRPETAITQREMDIAASIQSVTEEIVIKLCKGIKKTTGLQNLCIAGGVALNCVANGKLLKENIFENIWVQPASGDAGGALGAALAAYYLLNNGNNRVVCTPDGMRGGFLGPEYSQPDIERRLKSVGAVFKTISENDLIYEVVEYLAQGKSVGWHQGRMEFGPRSLGSRSILADPSSNNTQKQLNLKVKYRESFRPFAPSVLEGDASTWFEIEGSSPYMLFVANVKENKRIKISQKDENLIGFDKLKVKRSLIPAVTHVDYSARLQTVSHDVNPKFYNLIKKFKEKTGFPLLVNTSFNVRGEPIVCTPEDAFKCFMGTEIELLVIGNSVLYKRDQKNSRDYDYKKIYPLD